MNNRCFVSCSTIPKCPKILKNCHHNWYISSFKLNFLSNSTLEFINQNLNLTPYSCKGGFDWKTIDMDQCIKVLVVQSFHEVFEKNYWSLLAKWCFSVTSVLISFVRVTISKLTVNEKYKFQSCDFLHQNPYTPKIRKFFYFIDFCRYSVAYLLKTTGLMCSRKISVETFTFVETVYYKHCRFWSLIKILIVQNFQKVVNKDDSSRWCKRCFSVTTVWFPLMSVAISNFTLGEKDSIQISVGWFFASKSGHSQIRKFFN